MRTVLALGGRAIHLRFASVDSTLTFNLSFAYRFGSEGSTLLRNTRVRLGASNVLDEEPPLASGGFGYDPGFSQNLLAGRTWTLDVTKSF